jgi:hypothetical protein
MKMRSLFIGIAVLVSAVLIFSGCETETKTEYVTNTVTEEAQGFQLPDNAVTATSEAVLVALLADESGVYNDIAYAAAPSAAVTVPDGKTLYLNASSTITLAADLTVFGKLVVYGGTFTPGSNLKGTGTLDVELGGSLKVTDDTLFTGTAKLGAVNIKKYASLDATGATVDTEAKVTAWVGYAGNGYLKLTVTVITPKVTLDAIGARSDTNPVIVTNNIAPAATGTSLTVPAGVNLTTSDTLAAVTSLTVNGTLTASSATLATAGAAITLGSKGQVELDDVKLSDDVTVPAGAGFSIGTSSDFDGNTVTFKAGRSDIISDIDLVISGVDSDGYELNDSITLTSSQNLIIPEDTSVTVKAGKTISNAGTIILGEGSSLVLTGGPATAADTAGTKLTGAGKIVAGNTEISGVWQAVGADNTATVTIAASTTSGESSITASAATVVLTAGESGTITQNAGASNNLTIAADTTVALGGDGAKAGEIVLKNSSATNATDNGKLTLIGTITTDNAAGTNQASGAPLSADSTTEVSDATTYTKIGVANLAGDGTNAKVVVTNDPATAATSVAGKIAKLIGAASDATITGGDSTATVDGTKDGKISGETATAADSTS